MIGNCGYPDGLRFTWRGRVDWNQPSEFVKWEHLHWALERRLEFAGLRMMATEKAGDNIKLLVQRRPEGKRPRVKL